MPAETLPSGKFKITLEAEDGSFRKEIWAQYPEVTVENHYDQFTDPFRPQSGFRYARMRGSTLTFKCDLHPQQTYITQADLPGETLSQQHETHYTGKSILSFIKRLF